MSAGNPYTLQPGDLAGAEKPFVPLTSKPQIRFLNKAVQPPSYVYVDQGADIVCSCATSQTGELVTVSYRLLRADGDLILGQFTISPKNDRSLAIHSESLAEGFLLSASCKASVAVSRGQTFVRIFVSDPALGPGQPAYMLMSDYVTTAMAPTHPNGRVLSPVEGPGAQRVIVGTIAGSKLNWSVRVPVNARWRAISGASTFSTDAVAGNRSVTVSMTLGGSAAFFSEAPQTQAASLALVYGMMYGVAGLTNATNAINLPLPAGNIMLGNDVLAVVAQGADAGDQFLVATLAVEEWLDNV